LLVVGNKTLLLDHLGEPSSDEKKILKHIKKRILSKVN